MSTVQKVAVGVAIAVAYLAGAATGHKWDVRANDHLEQVEAAGLGSGQCGMPPESCPYTTADERKHWMWGWQRGYNSRRGELAFQARREWERRHGMNPFVGWEE